MKVPDVRRMPEAATMEAWLQRGQAVHHYPSVAGAALVEAISAQKVWEGSAAIWHLNQAGFALKAGGLIVYFDPYLSDRLEQLTSGHLDEHRRLFPPPVQASDINNADLVFCSHDHLDHVDPPALIEIARSSPHSRFVIPEAARKTLLGLGIEPRRLICLRGDDTQEIRGISVRAIPAAHTEFDYSEENGFPYLGFVVTIGGITIYHSGDCVMYDGLIERLRQHQIDVAFLSMNGDDWFKHGRNIMGNFSYRDAANLAVAAGVDLLVPMHIGQHAVNTERPGLLIDYLQEHYRYQKSHVMVPGERFIYVK